MANTDRLTNLYQRMYDLTEPECRQCRAPQSCCDSTACEMAIEYAKEEWGVELERTDHPTLPLMGPTGCTAAPHLRPLCTLHVCSIMGFGYKPNDEEWTNRYFELRERIEIGEMERWAESGKLLKAMGDE